MKKVLFFSILMFLVVIPTKAQTFAGRSGGDIFVLPPYRMCVGDDNGGQACFIQFGHQQAKLLGSLTLQGTLTLGTYKIASLPVLQGAGALATVTDGLTTSDCTAGGGSSIVFCQYNGILWTPIVGGGTATTTVSGLSAYAVKGAVVGVTDGTSSTDCTTGGGSTTVVCQYSGSAWTVASGGTTITIASGTAALGTSAISPNTCTTVVTVTATGVLTTDNIMADFNGDPTGSLGYQPGAMLTIVKYPTSGNVNFLVCNNTANSITPAAQTINWRVVR